MLFRSRIIQLIGTSPEIPGGQAHGKRARHDNNTAMPKRILCHEWLGEEGYALITVRHSLQFQQKTKARFPL